MALRKSGFRIAWRCSFSKLTSDSMDFSTKHGFEIQFGVQTTFISGCSELSLLESDRHPLTLLSHQIAVELPLLVH